MLKSHHVQKGEEKSSRSRTSYGQAQGEGPDVRGTPRPCPLPEWPLSQATGGRRYKASKRSEGRQRTGATRGPPGSGSGTLKMQLCSLALSRPTSCNFWRMTDDAGPCSSHL